MMRAKAKSFSLTGEQISFHIFEMPAVRQPPNDKYKIVWGGFSGMWRYDWG